MLVEKLHPLNNMNDKREKKMLKENTLYLVFKYLLSELLGKVRLKNILNKSTQHNVRRCTI